MASKQSVIYSSSDDEPDLGRFQTKKTKNKKILKKKIDNNSNNDMTKSTLMKTLPNSTEDLLHLCGEGAIPHNIYYNKKVGRKQPSYIHQKYGVYKRFDRDCKDRHGKKIKSSDGLFGCPLELSHYSSKEFDILTKFCDRLPDQVQKDMNCFSKYLCNSMLFVIDCDSIEAMDRCAKIKLLEKCPTTTSYSGKRHYWARRLPKEMKVATKLLAKNFYLSVAKEEFPQSKTPIDDYMEKYPENNIDYLYSGNLFEMRYNKNGDARVVDNWDGKLESIPTISIAEIQETFGVRINIMGSKRDKEIETENTRIAREACKTMEDDNWSGACFEVPADAEVVIKLLGAVPLDYLVNFKGWQTVAYIIKNQGTATKSYLDDFNRKMEEVFNSVMGKDKKYKGNTFLVWKNENIKFFAQKEKDYTGPKLTIHTLWKIVYENDRKAWSKIRNKQGGLPSHRLMASLKYYDAQKEYFENYGHYVIGETEPVIVVQNYSLNKPMIMKKAQFKNQVWDKVGSYRRQPVKKDGEIVLVDGRPKMEDKYMGDFPDVWLKDVDAKVYEREVFLPDGYEHSNDAYAKDGATDLNVNTWKGLAIKQLAEAKDSGLYDAVEKQMAKDLEDHDDKWYSIRKIRELCWYLCGQEKDTFEFVEMWVSYNLKYPGLLTGVILLFSSVPGCGKNVYWDNWIGKLIGSDYYLSSGNPQAFFEKHATAIENKVLALVNEMNYKIMKSNQEVIKTRATEYEVYFNPKNLPAREARNCCNVVMAMNGTNPPLEQDDRRYCLIRSSRSHKYKPGYFRDVVEAMDSQVNQVIYLKYMEEQVNCPFDYPFERNIPKTAFHKTRAAQGMDVAIKFGMYLMCLYNRAVEQKVKKCECSSFAYDDSKVKCNCVYGIVRPGTDDTELTKTYSLWKKWSAEKGELGGDAGVKNFSSFKSAIASHTKKQPIESKAKRAIWEKEEDSYCQFFLTMRKKKKDGERVNRVYFDTDRFAHFYAWHQEKETKEPYKKHLEEIKTCGTQNYVETKGLDAYITDAGETQDELLLDDDEDEFM